MTYQEKVVVVAAHHVGCCVHARYDIGLVGVNDVLAVLLTDVTTP